jgi:hypothetical protein
MTVVLIALGAIAAAAGTRLAAAFFIGAAVAGALGSDLAAVSTWSAALAAGCVLLSPASPRWIALPALGLAAVVAAGLAHNSAVVMTLWVLGTGAAAVSSESTEEGRRWAFALCALDATLLAVLAVASIDSFEGWPATLGTVSSGLLLAAAGVRACLVAAPSAVPPFAGLLVVRTQVAVLVAVSVAAGGPGIARAAIVLGAAGFAVGPFLRRPVAVDAIQELSLYALAIASTELGWTSRGWAWGALAAGTLIHQLRFMVGRGVAGQWVELVLRSAGIGLPFLPVVGALLEGSLGPRGWEAAVIAAGTLIGSAARLGTPLARPRRRARGWVDDVRGPVVVALAVVASLSASALSLPRPPGGAAVHWPDVVALVAVGSAAIVGSRFRLVGSKAAPANAAPDLAERLPVTVEAVPARPVVLWTALGVLGAGAVALWIAGVTRGFL